MFSLQSIHIADLADASRHSGIQTEGRELIDIEALLTRAYRDRCVDRITPEAILAMPTPSGFGGSSTAVVMAHCALGTEIDKSTAGANFLGRANMMATIEDDFLALHDAVLRAPCVYADAPIGAEFVLWDDALIERAADLGYEIRRRTVERRERDLTREYTWQESRPALIGQRRYEPAVVRAPRGLRNGVALEPSAAPSAPPMRPLHPIEPSVLVIVNGRSGTRPDVSPLVVERWEPIYVGRSKAAARYEPVWQTSPEEVALQRARYAAWHECLRWLAASLSEPGRLDLFEITGPSAQAEPWAAENVVYLEPEPEQNARRRARGA